MKSTEVTYPSGPIMVSLTVGDLAIICLWWCCFAGLIFSLRLNGEPQGLPLLLHLLVSSFKLIGNLSIQDGLLDGVLDDSHRLRGWNSKSFLNIISGNG